MPLVNFDDPAEWGRMYSVPYTREHREEIYGHGMADAHGLRLALEGVGMKATDAIVIVGAGYGWVDEAWRDVGYSRIVSCDTSALIQSGKGRHSAVPVLNESSGTAASRASILSALGSAADWVVTEDVLPCFSDAEIAPYLPNFRALGGKVAHWLTPKLPGNFMNLNWKTPEEWKGFVAPDYVIVRGAREVA